eukprot:7391632-Prymnesium_polylepis.2
MFMIYVRYGAHAHAARRRGVTAVWPYTVAPTRLFRYSKGLRTMYVHTLRTGSGCAREALEISKYESEMEF